MEGLFQLLLIVLFIAAAAFDAMKRNRERERRKGRMEAEEAEEAQAAEGARDPNRRRKAPMGPPRGGTEDRRTGTTEVGGSGEEPGPRRTADELVPEDLWAILTGQPLPPRREEESPEEPSVEPAPRGSEGRGREGEGRFDELPAEPRIPTPVPSDRMSSSSKGSSPPPEETPTRRSAGWMEGVEAVEARDREQLAAEEAAAFGSIADEEPWDEYEDITEGEIFDGAGRTQGADTPASRKEKRRKAGRSPYTRLLESGKREDLRKAVVLREILGPPVGFRETDVDRF